MDTIQAICMGIDPGSVTHLASCAARGIGTHERARIEVRGLQPETQVLGFKPARHNAVSRVETILRQSTIKRLPKVDDVHPGDIGDRECDGGLSVVSHRPTHRFDIATSDGADVLDTNELLDRTVGSHPRIRTRPKLLNR